MLPWTIVVDDWNCNDKILNGGRIVVVKDVGTHVIDDWNCKNKIVNGGRIIQVNDVI